jgi:hypothetical protein
MSSTVIPKFAQHFAEQKAKDAKKPYYFESIRQGERELYKIVGSQIWRIHKESHNFGKNGRIQVKVDYYENAPDYQIEMIKNSLQYHPVSQQLWNLLLDQVIIHLRNL